MQRTKTVSIPFAIHSQMGRDADEGVPLGWIKAWVQDVEQQIPDSEESSCLVFGAPGMRADYQHTLTPLEAMTEERDEVAAKLATLKHLIHPDGTLVADAAARIKALLS